METLEQLKEIVKNAPDGATHVTESDKYLMVQGCFVKVFNNLSVWSVPICNVEDVFLNENPRLLSDIKLIIELMEAVNSLPDKLDTKKWLEGLDRPTEFAISQAKSFAIGSVFDSIRKAKKLL